MRQAICVLLVLVLLLTLLAGCAKKKVESREAAPDQKALGAGLIEKAGGGQTAAPAPPATPKSDKSGG